MRNYALVDLERKDPGLLMQFPDDIAAKRAVKATLREGKTTFALFPKKFALVYVGFLEVTENPDEEGELVITLNFDGQEYVCQDLTELVRELKEEENGRKK